VTPSSAAAPPTREPLAGTIHLLPISHLDTQWRWTVRETAARLLPATVRANAAAFEQYPSYRVNFDGAFRYRLLAEHHPAEWAEVRRWIEAGRWQVTGATWDAMDANLPSVESLVRQVLQGRRWFRQQLGRDPRDLFLPDCFGFGAQVPVVAAHCGLLAFTTSKLRRFGDMRSAFGIPFPLGWWEGLDGSRLLAALDPGGYGEPLVIPPADDPEVQEQLRRYQRLLGCGVAVRFFGIGDRGGAPPPRSLETLERAVAAAGEVRTVAGGSDETFRRLAAELPAERLPVYRGELLLSVHGTGCYTSQTAMKRWNANNERLAAAAERAAAAAAWLGGVRYPAERLREAWRRFLWHQFHDDLTGTSIPAAYAISWQDEAIAASTFAATLRGAAGAVARALDTRAEGVALLVFNPLPHARRELVSARVPWLGAAGAGAPVTVVGPDGALLPAQIDGPGRETGDGTALLRFVADLPPLGFAVFDVLQAPSEVVADPELRPLPRGLESGRYRLLLDTEGNLSSLFDRALGRELLAGPLRLELFADRSARFPAWEVRHEDLERGPLARVGGPATVRALPSGPAAVAIEVRRRLGRSTFVERYRLPAAAVGTAAESTPLVEISIACRWRHRGRLLKASLHSAAGASEAVYDAGVAGVGRGRNTPSLYEVPAQAWASLTEEGDAWGVALLTDRAGGWDHPAKHVLRRTLVRTPATGRRFPHQAFQDLGDHRWELALAGHHGDWRVANVPALAARFRNPPLTFVVAPSAGPLGRQWSFLTVDGGELAALKEHEEGGEWVVRLLDPTGSGARARITVAGDVAGCRQLDGCEDALASGEASDLAAARVDGDTVEVSRPPFRPLTLGLRLAPPARPLPAPRSAALELPLDRAVVTANGEPSSGGLGRRRLAIPAELWPLTHEVDGIHLRLGIGGGRNAQACGCAGQLLRLPAGRWERLLLLLAASDVERRLPLRVGGAEVELVAPAALAPLAQEDRVARFGFARLALWRVRPGYARRGEVAWVVDHCHDRAGRDVPYTPLCLFAAEVALGDATEVTLPDAPDVLLFAASASAGGGEATAAWVD
jgi:alpha-mannosidase